MILVSSMATYLPSTFQDPSEPRSWSRSPVDDPNADMWFQHRCLCDPAAFTFGTATRKESVGTGLKKADVALDREIP